MSGGRPIPGAMGGLLSGRGTLAIPAPPEGFLSLGWINVVFDTPTGGNGTVTVKVGGVQRWQAPVNGGLFVYFTNGYLDTTPGQAIVIECPNAWITTAGSNIVDYS